MEFIASKLSQMNEQDYLDFCRYKEAEQRKIEVLDDGIAREIMIEQGHDAHREYYSECIEKRRENLAAFDEKMHKLFETIGRPPKPIDAENMSAPEFAFTLFVALYWYAHDLDQPHPAYEVMCWSPDMRPKRPESGRWQVSWEAGPYDWGVALGNTNGGSFEHREYPDSDAESPVFKNLLKYKERGWHIESYWGCDAVICED